MRCIYVHGGVSGMPKESPSLKHAIDMARPASSSLDAVHRAVLSLEDDPALNAGFGSVLTRDGDIELDAGIADGATGNCGGVAGVHVRHPITLARRVMEKSPHVLLIGDGAMEFGDDLEILDDTTDEQRERWLKARDDGSLDLSRYGAAEHVDTVGAVAVDDDGDTAAASSTGGVFGKMPGRVGDAPIFGAGVYASKHASVVGTGVGELFLETLAAVRVGALIERGAAPSDACVEVIGSLGNRSDTAAGLLAVDRNGRVGAAFRGGSWAVEGPDGPVDAIHVT